MSNYQLFQNDLPFKSLKSFKGCISIDTETLGLNIKRDRLCLIQLKNEHNKKIYLIQFDSDLSPKNSKNIKTLLENRSLTKILSTLSKKYYYPRGKKIMLIIDELKNNKASKKTIHGFVVEKLANSVIIYSEIKKKG